MVVPSWEHRWNLMVGFSTREEADKVLLIEIQTEEVAQRRTEVVASATNRNTVSEAEAIRRFIYAHQ